MSEGNVVDAFSWLDGGIPRWGVVAGGTTVVLILVVIVIVLCMRGGNDDGYTKSTSPYFEEKDHRPSFSSYGGMVSVPIDGGSAMSGAPPPYHTLTNTQKVQPGGPQAPETFGKGVPFNPQILAPAPNGIKLRPPPLPPYDVHSLSPGLTDYSSSSEDEEEQTGKVWFTARYDQNTETLEVEILKAKIHAIREKNTSQTEIHIKVSVLPDETLQYQTKGKRKTMTPKFNEHFIFTHVGGADLHTHVLRISTCLTERGATTCLGHILVTLEDLYFGEVEVRELGSHSEPSQLGEVNFSMTYHPQNEKLRLTINKCRNLRKIIPIEKGPESPHIYIKTQVICGRKQLDQQTTTVQPADLDVEFNEKMTFTLTQKQMRTASVVVTLMRQKPEELEAPFEEIYSSVTVGPYMFLHREALRHWQEMVTYPRTKITHWHGLR